MSNERECGNKETVIQYQIKEAYNYIKEHESKDGSEDRLDVCIIANLLRILATETSTRAAMKTVIRHLLELAEEDAFRISHDKWDDVIENAHDDEMFLSELVDWFKDHIDTFGENYGLDYPEE